ncbi:MAG: hypothetical protein KJZ87_15560, partial [Thermoguttaceae bacterium]|nr:hypothetical protein [Thermoguttaceae bacterium]
MIRWRMDRDVFEPGAWFHGRIYEERCDLSPDGNLLVSFCYKGTDRPGYRDSWTAVSRAPWLHALALWPLSGTWGGGGRFLDNRRLTLHCRGVADTHPDHPATGLEMVLNEAEYFESNPSTGEVSNATWSGRDHTGNLIFCRDGQL